MDALSGERGQSLVAAVLLLGLAAMTVAGLRGAQERLLVSAREQRLGEAAVAAAGAAVADAELAFVGALGERREASGAERAVFLASAEVREAALAAASEVLAAHGAASALDVAVRDAGRSVEIDISLARRPYRASFERSRCCPR